MSRILTRSLYRRETLNNLSFLNHGDDSVPNCVMATLKRADGQEVSCSANAIVSQEHLFCGETRL